MNIQIYLSEFYLILQIVTCYLIFYGIGVTGNVMRYDPWP